MTSYAQININKLKDKKSDVKTTVNKNKGKVAPASEWVDKFNRSMSSLQDELNEGYIGTGADRNMQECQNAIDSITALKPSHKQIPRMKSELNAQRDVYNEISVNNKVKGWTIRFNSTLSIAADYINKGQINDSNDRRFKDCTNALDSIKSVKPDYEDLEKMQQEYDGYYRKHYVLVKTDHFDRLFSRYEQFINSCREGTIDFSRSSSSRKRSSFDASLAEFNEDNLKNESLNERCKAIGDFYTNPEEKGRKIAVGHLSNALYETRYWSKENRQTPEFFDEFTQDSSPKKDTLLLIKKLETYNILKEIFPDEKELDETKVRVEARLQDLREFVSSGEYAEWIEKAYQRKVDSVIPFKNLKSDSEVSTAVKKDWNSELGTIIKINIIDSAWGINKLYNGRIKSKNIALQIIFKDEESMCWIITGTVKKEYYETYYGEAQYTGGSYPQEMNCSNVNKSVERPK